MKKVLLLAALSVLAAALVIPAAFAGNGPAPKTTGDISYANPWTGDATHITFVAQDLGGGSAKGNMSYADSTGRSYEGRRHRGARHRQQACVVHGVRDFEHNSTIPRLERWSRWTSLTTESLASMTASSKLDEGYFFGSAP